MTTIWAFDHMEDKHILYLQEDYCIIHVDREAWHTAYVILYFNVLDEISVIFHSG